LETNGYIWKLFENAAAPHNYKLAAPENKVLCMRRTMATRQGINYFATGAETMGSW
jgi:hypothetical protein